MEAFALWWEHLSWSQAAFWVLVFCLLPWSIWMGMNFFMYDEEFRSSHEDQFANSSRRDYVAKRGLRG